MLKKFLKNSSRRQLQTCLAMANFNTTQSPMQQFAMIPISALDNNLIYTADFIKQIDAKMENDELLSKTNEGNLNKIYRIKMPKSYKKLFLDRKLPSMMPVSLPQLTGGKMVEPEGSNEVYYYYSAEFNKNSLSKRIAELKESNQYLSLEDYRNLWEQTVAPLRIYEKFLNSHSQLTPENIVYSSNSWMLINYSLDPSLQTKPSIYQAPEKVLKKPLTCVRNVLGFASDLFSIGLILLAAGERWNDSEVTKIYSNGVLNHSCEFQLAQAMVAK